MNINHDTLSNIVSDKRNIIDSNIVITRHRNVLKKLYCCYYRYNYLFFPVNIFKDEIRSTQMNIVWNILIYLFTNVFIFASISFKRD